MPGSALVRNALWKGIGLIPSCWRLKARSYLIERGWSDPEIEWRYLSRLGPNRGLAIDIGANRGLYSYKLAQLYDWVAAFEPNQGIASELAALKSPRIELHSVALSSERGPGLLHIPHNEKEELDGWGSLDPHSCPGATGSRTCSVKRQTLDDFSLRDVAFIKIDVEGHELAVLQGARNTLAISDPVILIEIRSDNERPVFDLLASYGYKPIDLAVKLNGPSSQGMFLFQRNNSLQ